MPMTDMARSPKELDTSKDEVMMDEDKYPYGLKIHLHDEELDKLGISELPNVGEKIKLEAVVVVESVSERQELGDENDRDVRLQITEMGLIAESKDAAHELYGD